MWVQRNRRARKQANPNSENRMVSFAIKIGWFLIGWALSNSMPNEVNQKGLIQTLGVNHGHKLGGRGVITGLSQLRFNEHEMCHPQMSINWGLKSSNHIFFKKGSFQKTHPLLVLVGKCQFYYHWHHISNIHNNLPQLKGRLEKEKS